MIDYYGDNFKWFIGIVEDNKNDPLKLGRVRVRVFGVHSPYFNQIEIDDLPWATTLMSPNGGISGVGRGDICEEGAWVFGFFMDEEMQNPVVLGTLPRIEIPGPDNINPMPVEPGAVHNDAPSPQPPRGVSNAEKVTMGAIDRGFSPAVGAAMVGALAVETGNPNLSPLTELLPGQVP